MTPSIEQFRIAYTLICVFCIQLNAIAQIPVHYRFDVTKGINSNVVYDVVFDSVGFLWLTTEEGLMRFDGNTFKSFIYTNNKYRAGSSIQIDQNGRVWYQSFDGNIFFLENDSIKEFTLGRELYYSSILIEGDHLIYLDGMSLVFYDLNSNQIKWKVPLPTQYITSLVKFDDHYYLGGDYLYLVNVQDQKVEKVGNINNIISIFSNGNRFILQVNQNNQHILYEYDYKGFYKLFETPYRINSIHFSENDLIIADNQGIHIYEQGVFKNYFINESFSKILIDHNKQLIGATTRGGILIIPNQNDLEIVNLKNELFSSFFIEGDEIYFGTEHGKILQLSITEKSTKTLYLDSLRRRINSFVYIKEKKLLFIALSNEILIIKNNKPIFKLTNYASKDLKLIDGKYILTSTTGHGGFLNYIVDKNISSSWDSLFQSLELVNQIKVLNTSSRNREAVYLSNEKIILFSTNNGQILIDRDGKYKIFENLVLNKIFTLNNEIYGVDFNNNLIVFDKKYLKFKIVLENSGNQFNNVIPGDKNVFFVSNDKVLKMAHGQMVEFSQNILNNIIKIIERDKYIINIETNRVLYISKDITTSEDKQIKVFIEKINGYAVDNEKDIISVKNNSNDINLEFTYLNLNFKNHSNLYYRINSSEWQELFSSARNIFIPAVRNASKLNIEFGIKQNNNIETLRHYYIEIRRPLYKQGWFIFLLQILFFSSVVLYIYWQVILYKKKNKLILEKSLVEMNLAKMTLKSIKSQMNPHFFFNALNTIQAFIYNNDKLTATEYLSKFSKLTRLILESSEEEYISLEQELNLTNFYLQLEKVRFSDEFSFEINVDDSINTDEVLIPTLMFQPFIENSIKHGLLHKSGSKILKLFLFLTDDGRIVVEIIDNGIGIKRSREINSINYPKHKSFSTEASFKRIEMLSKIKGKKYDFKIEELFDINQNTIGTKVTLIIPI